ncbi:MAG TPA: hypothetical protein VJN43_01920 [Bryobacteraceae bacterium]|nr:hypothetical protein [Bryobacteraceae bacterium]
MRSQKSNRPTPRIMLPWIFCIAACTSYAQQPRPNPAAQDKILEAMHHYAAQYVSNLPNFLCEQVTRELEAGKKSNHWHKLDILVSRLSYNRGREERTLAQVNGKPFDPHKARRRSPLTTEGEFGILLSRILGPESEAWFTWNRWEVVRGKRLAVFDFEVDKLHSTMTLTMSDLVKATIPYRGAIYGDPETGAVWRITQTAYNIPRSLMTREFSTTIDYDEIRIADKTYLLPVEAEVTALLETRKIRNELTFEDYRKFEADSAITFGSVAPQKDDESAKPTAPPKR